MDVGAKARRVINGRTTNSVDLRVLAGRPYSAYVPIALHVHRADFVAFNGQREFARPGFIPGPGPALLASVDCSEDARSIQSLMEPDRQLRPSLRGSVQLLLETPRITARALQKAHAKLVPARKGAFRSRIVWMDAYHPADAWYVAPVPARLPKLMEELTSFVDEAPFSPMLVACVAYLRLLHIHPFEDGNGRLARALFIAIGVRALGMCPGIVRVLDIINADRFLHLHRDSLAIRSDGDWSSYLRRCARAIAASGARLETLSPAALT